MHGLGQTVWTSLCFSSSCSTVKSLFLEHRKNRRSWKLHCQHTLLLEVWITAVPPEILLRFFAASMVNPVLAQPVILDRLILFPLLNDGFNSAPEEYYLRTMHSLNISTTLLFQSIKTEEVWLINACHTFKMYFH